MKNEMRKRLWEEASGCCIYCGHPLSLQEMEADHILPKASGGENGFRNRVCSCPACNDAKADTLLGVFLVSSMTEKRMLRYRRRLETLVEQGKMTESKARVLYPFEEEPDEEESGPLGLTDWQVISVLADILIEKLSQIRYNHGKNEKYRRYYKQQEAGGIGSPHRGPSGRIVGSQGGCAGG